MKAIKRRIQKFSRPIVILLATVVVILTSIVVATATQTITTPNAAVVSYSLAPGASSAPITPVANQPVLVMGCQLEVGFRGVGQVTMLRIPGSFLEWVGLESTAAAAIAQGFSGAPGTHILWIDFSHQVDLRVNSTDTFIVQNNSTGQRSGNVKLIW